MHRYGLESSSANDLMVSHVSNTYHMYTCSGDSWRARASFIWELQVNISAKTMQVDFGGEDRYDGTERARNFGMVEVYSM